MTRREAIESAEAELAAALEHTQACQDRYDRKQTPENDAALNAAYDAEVRARETALLARELAPAPLRLRRDRGEVVT
jgi:hypothetical protein